MSFFTNSFPQVFESGRGRGRSRGRSRGHARASTLRGKGRGQSWGRVRAVQGLDFEGERGVERRQGLG